MARPSLKILGCAGLGLHVGQSLGLILEPERRAGPDQACRKHDFSLVWAGPGFALLGRGLGLIYKPEGQAGLGLCLKI
jgi:hypothetical protein